MLNHTTNYYNTFIEVAEDCPAISGEITPMKGNEKTIANIQFEMISQNPYKYNSDEILFHCFATKKGLTKNELQTEREIFFSKGQPCFRSSPLTKRYGWGIHSNAKSKIAMYGVETNEYKKLVTDKNLKIVKAMRSKRK
ncbi:MAG: DUF6157 family protein [Parafilimonas sp.]